MDKLFEMLFLDKDRWERGIKKAKEKDMDRNDLSCLCDPYVRADFAQRILAGEYDVAPSHMQLIPKDNPGEFRTVYINENIDRVFLNMVNDLLIETCQDMIHPACVSYQPGIGCGKIVQEISNILARENKNKILGWKSDLSKYFDSVPLWAIERVFDKVEEKWGKSSVINVLRKYYRQDLCFDTEGNLIEHYQSLKQGCAVAAFLANVLLYEMDEALSEMAARVGGCYYRYSDDCLFIGSNYKKAMDTMKSILDKFELTLNPKKVEYISPNRWFKFLGFMLKGDKITLSKRRIDKLKKEIKIRTLGCDRKNPNRTKIAIKKLNYYFYSGEYSLAAAILPYINVEEDIKQIDEFALDCLRATMTKREKIGGIGVSYTKKYDYTIFRTLGEDVNGNKEHTPKEIKGYRTLACVKEALGTDRNAFETVIRTMNIY